MAEDWNAIAAEVEGALRSVGDVSHPDGYPVTIRRMTEGNQWDPDDFGTTAYYPFVGFDQTREIRDAAGAMTGETRRTVTVNAMGSITPTQSDTIAVGVKAAEATDTSPWQEILAVRPLSPAGVAVLIEVDIAS
jgi:hypothetical protein